MSANPLLSIEGLTASVDEKTILHNVNLNVAAGETHVLMGPNGAGKSTLGHLVMGDPVYTVQDGRIVFDGQDITELTTDKRSRAGLFLSFQAPVEIPGVPLSSFLRASIAGRPGLEMKGKEFRRRVKELAAELNMDTAYLNRELGVGFSGGEKKKVEMLQLLLLQPKLAILDETDSGLDVDALSTVSHGMDAYRKSCDGSMLIITHNTRILEHLDVDRVHVMVKGHIVREDDASLIPWIDKNGFETFEREAAKQRAQAESAAAEQQAKEKYEQGSYVEAYSKLQGLSIKERDEKLYHQLATLAAVSEKYQAYLVFDNYGSKIDALDALVCAYGRYDLNQKNAKEYGCEDQLEKIGGKIIKALLKDYDMTGDEALDIYQTRKRDDYTVKLHQKLKELGLG